MEWFLLLALVGFFLIYRLPTLLDQHERQGQKIVIRDPLVDLQGQILQPPYNQAMAYIFWATWCGPCEVELARVNRMVKSGSIPKNRVIAIAVREDYAVVKAAVAERGYAMNVAIDPDGRWSEAFGVQGTPTVALLRSDNTLSWITIGISPTLEFRLKSHLQ